jgi:hypothetical protein
VIKPGVIKSVMLLVCIGITLLASVEPIAGQMMGEHTANTSVVQPISGNQSANETMMYCVTDNLSANETMMYCVTGNYSALDRLECARFWLKKAIELHKVHLKDPSTATNESQMEMMDQMMRAYDCIIGENMTTGMVNTTGGNVS